MTRTASVCIPVYKQIPSESEVAALEFSLPKLSDFNIYLLCPRKLDTSFYDASFSNLQKLEFDDYFFQSERTYSELLLRLEFYDCFSTDYLLILQPDALIFSDSLNYWIDERYDYIGAPWPSGIDFPFSILTPSFPSTYSVRPTVGNGGLSLRRISSIRKILEKYAAQAAVWRNVGNPEDVFLGMALVLLPGARLPNLITAASFSIETNPSFFLPLLEGAIPFGCHAFDRYEPSFWREQSFWPKELL